MQSISINLRDTVNKQHITIELPADEAASDLIARLEKELELPEDNYILLSRKEKRRLEAEETLAAAGVEAGGEVWIMPSALPEDANPNPAGINPKLALACGGIVVVVLLILLVVMLVLGFGGALEGAGLLAA